MALNSVRSGAQILRNLPQIATLPTDIKRLGKAQPMMDTTFDWNARITFHKPKANTSPKHTLSMLFANLQRSDPELQLLPFDEGSLANPITALKNIPSESSKLDVYVQLPEDTKPYYRVINLFVRFSSSVSPISIKNCTFDYLKRKKYTYRRMTYLHAIS